MNWAALVAVILELLGPLIRRWLEDLLSRAEPAGEPALVDPPAAVARLFGAARGRLWWWQFGQRARLAVCERVAVRHAAGLYAAVLAGHPVPRLTAADEAELATVS